MPGQLLKPIEFAGRQVEVARYVDIRDQVDTADGLFFWGNAATCRIISWVTDGPSHFGLGLRLREYEGEEARRWTLEAVGNGVMPRLLSEKLAGYHGAVVWAQLAPFYGPDSRRKAGEYALSKVGKSYDFGSLLWNAFSRSRADDESFICSEYGQFAYYKAGILPWSRKAFRPVDLWRSPIFSRLVMIEEVTA